MNRWWLGTIATALILAPASAEAQSDPVSGPLEGLDPLTRATWTASGTGFSTTLHYRWIFPGRVLEVANELRNGAGQVTRRYHGIYAWDAGRNEITFLTAADNGEVHRGRAWWRDGVLWHEAEISGGNIAAYASAIRIADGRVEYFADYATRSATPALLNSTPLSYQPTTVAPPEQ